MHDIIAKIARLAVSKAAAFFYAVAVGVAANLAFNFVQQHHSALAVATAPHEAPATAGPAMPAVAPAVIAPTTPPADAARAPTQVAPPAAPVKPAAAPQRAAATFPLPQPPTAITLPSLASFPTPALKPTALPPLLPPPLPVGDGRMGVEAAPPTAPAATGDAAPTVPSQAPPPAAAQPTLGPAIEVAAPPAPTFLPPPFLPPPVAAAKAAASGETPSSLELSDVWHPYRAVKKGLHWAGEQVPLIGGDEAASQPRAAVPSAPISLLPPAAKPAEKADALTSPPRPAAPGPGSGGLY